MFVRTQLWAEAVGRAVHSRGLLYMSWEGCVICREGGIGGCVSVARAGPSLKNRH